MGGKSEHVYRKLGDSTLLIEWPDTIHQRTLEEILQVEEYLKKSQPKGIVDFNHAYNSLAIMFDPEKTSHEKIRILLDKGRIGFHNIKKERKSWNIPVCYDPDLGIDLNIYCQKKDLTPEKLIEIHSQAIYTVFFHGFLPGFMYLGGLDESLSIPRKANPDRKIPRGSVAIGGEQTGIYPVESPGGWYVIGKSPLNFFKPDAIPPCNISPGDKLIFQPISTTKYKQLEIEVLSGVYEFEFEVIDE